MNLERLLRTTAVNDYGSIAITTTSTTLESGARVGVEIAALSASKAKK